ncbi:SAM-dependent methyltransferase [Nocardia iowensis]|uniref:SAM-dependent methyltransferase n=1 Tax=Nocardia iowensis TaxID=204891 RepID=A0ABX8RZV2_NOCIO|nr:SAM-dependent methyltransferase [Nocardia iowensis]QXN95178.1 SAM-dependent methyltransferase [Nocardia iowensis]
MPSGSYLAMRDDADDSPGYVKLREHYTGIRGASHVPRLEEEIRSVLDGPKLMRRGSISISQWQPDATEPPLTRTISANSAVDRKP